MIAFGWYIMCSIFKKVKKLALLKSLVVLYSHNNNNTLTLKLMLLSSVIKEYCIHELFESDKSLCPDGCNVDNDSGTPRSKNDIPLPLIGPPPRQIKPSFPAYSATI